MRLLNVVTTALLGWGLCAAPLWADVPEKPNIIMIFVDDLGYGDTGVYNQLDRCGQGLPCIQTPRIDQMAAEGMMFTNMYSSAPLCAPARGSLMTGFHTGHATIRDNGQNLRKKDITVAEVLKRAGYATAMIGKWGIGTVGDGTSPEQKGFDLGYGYNDHVHAWEHYTDYLYRNGVIEYIPENFGDPGVCTEEVVFTQDLFTNEALAFIEANAAGPFYLQLSYIIPHKWNVCPDLFSYEFESWPLIEKHFAAQITYMDADVGRILDRLVQLGIAGNTLVLFTSDNGPQQTSTPDCGSHSASFFDGNAFLRGIKFQLWEGGIREPFIAWWPGVIQPGTTSDLIGSLEDFMPTAAELAGVPVPSGIDGVSYAPTLTGQGTQQTRPYYYWEYSGMKAVRSGQYKALWDGTNRLYDLEADPGEQNNLAGDPAYSAILTQLTQYRNAAHSDGSPAVTDPILALAGDATGGGSTYTLDFGTVLLNETPVTLTFRVRNGATSYSNLLEGEVDFQFTDPRLGATDGSYAWLVDGSESDDFTVTLTPSTVGALNGQVVVITGRQYIFGTPAVNSPITLTVTGTVFDPDCNWNGIPDECDLTCADGCDIYPDCGQSEDCQGDGFPDECQLAGNDCNNDEVPDDCQLTGNDCNENGVPDECDIAGGSSQDTNGNGIPDECEPSCLGDLNGDNQVNFADFELMAGNLGLAGGATYGDGDLDFDADVDLADFSHLQVTFGTVCETPTLGYWRFEETAGNVVDWGPNGLNGFVNGRSLVTDVPVNPVPQNGYANTQSVDLYGDGGRVQIDDPSGILDTDQSFTIEAWVRLNSWGEYGANGRQWLIQKKRIDVGHTDDRLTYGLLANAGDLTSDFQYGKTSGRTGSELALMFGYNNTLAWSIVSYLEVDDSDWHFISVAFDADNDEVRFNIDDQFETISFTDHGHFIPNNHGPLIIGAHQNASNQWNQWIDGKVDEVRISSGVLPAGQLLNAP